MKHTIEQIQLAYARGAEVESELDGKWMPVTDLNFSYIPNPYMPNNYRLANPERDAHLTQFDLYPFDLERALAGEELVTSGGYKVLGFNVITNTNFAYPCQILVGIGGGEETHFVSKDGHFCSAEYPSTKDVFMKHPPKQEATKEKPNKPDQKLEPWQVILANYGREIRHAEWQAKWESGIELEMFNRDSKSWYIPAYAPCDYPEHVKFREKPKPVKVSSWCIDVRCADSIQVFTYESEHEADLCSEELKNEGRKVLSEPYLKVYIFEV